ncbi:MAG: hypothetical protein PWP46_732 [Fusobacteriaceae bacterium]|jgi:GntR family transcriptional regulator|nr:transcriptional regulator, GntR family [Fusobacteriales bacterium]MDN5303853.1 hypothetical protein [Fusobacteriaceae bacterium]
MMEIKINRDSNLSIHTQLKEQIKGLIIDGELLNGEQLPTVRQLGDFLQINKNTVSKVYSELEEEGYVESLKGKGTFVKYERDTKKIKFLKEIEDVLKKGIEEGIDIDEIIGMTYFKSHYLKFMILKGEIKKAALIECNPGSIIDFKTMVKKEIGDIEIKGILIDDLLENYKKIKKEIEDIKLIIIPYIHYNEVSKILEKFEGKEIFTLGISQSIKLLNYGKKMKNKIVGIIGEDNQEEEIINRQFKRMKIKEFKLFTKEKTTIKEFLRSIDFLIISPKKLEEYGNQIKPKRPYIVFEGKYAIDDIKILKEIFE